MKPAFVLAFCLALCGVSAAQTPQRPRITGIDHVVFYTTSAQAQTESFYVNLLQLTATATEGGQQRYRIGSHQWVGFTPAPDAKSANQWKRIAYTTESVKGLRKYLESKGVKAGKIEKRGDHSLAFAVTDPDGTPLEFVERPRGEAKPAVPPAAISHRLIHAGAIVHDRAAADKFYRDILGFRVYWQGGGEDNRTDYVAMQVPEGTDWFEYMLNIGPNPDQRTLGVMNHISLGVPDMDKAEAMLLSRGWKPGDWEHKLVGRDGKKELNIYDPDHIRVEFMEFRPTQKPCCAEFTGPHPSENE